MSVTELWRTRSQRGDASSRAEWSAGRCCWLGSAAWLNPRKEVSPEPSAFAQQHPRHMQQTRSTIVKEIISLLLVKVWLSYLIPSPACILLIFLLMSFSRVDNISACCPTIIAYRPICCHWWVVPQIIVGFSFYVRSTPLRCCRKSKKKCL